MVEVPVMRIGLVGAGLISGMHASALGRSGAAVLSAVCDVNVERAAEIARPARAAFYASYDEMFKSGLVDGVIICLPHGLHAEVVACAIRSGLHVLVEKPLATSMAQVRGLLELTSVSDRVVSVAHLQRFLPRLVAAKNLIDQGEVGNLQFLIDRRTSEYRAGTRPAWFFDPDLSGGGVVMNVGSHCVDRIHWLTGSRAVRVFASLSSAGNVGVETDCMAFLELANGVKASIGLTGNGESPVDRIDIVGDAVSFGISHDVSGTFRRAEEGAGGMQVVNDIDVAFDAQLEDFVMAVTQGSLPRCTPEEAASVVATVLAIYASGERGGWVTVER